MVSSAAPASARHARSTWRLSCCYWDRDGDWDGDRGSKRDDGVGAARLVQHRQTRAEEGKELILRLLAAPCRLWGLAILVAALRLGRMEVSTKADSRRLGVEAAAKAQDDILELGGQRVGGRRGHLPVVQVKGLGKVGGGHAQEVLGVLRKGGRRYKKLELES